MKEQFHDHYVNANIEEFQPDDSCPELTRYKLWDVVLILIESVYDTNSRR